MLCHISEPNDPMSSDDGICVVKSRFVSAWMRLHAGVQGTTRIQQIFSVPEVSRVLAEAALTTHLLQVFPRRLDTDYYPVVQSLARNSRTPGQNACRGTKQLKMSKGLNLCG